MHFAEESEEQNLQTSGNSVITEIPGGAIERDAPRSLLQSIGFFCALVVVFLRFSFLHETFTFLTGVNTYVLYIFSPLAIVSAFASGGLQKIWREKAGRYWIFFFLWMSLAVPFSSWIGGSTGFVFSYLRTNLPMLFISASCSNTWKDARKMMYTVAAAAIVTMATAHFFVAADSNGRLALSWGGTISNSNDLATHLLMVLPFLLFIAIRPGTVFVFRILCGAAIAIGMYQVLRTGSRGALIAVALTLVYILATGTSKQRIAVLLLGPVSLIALVTLLPSSTWQRLMSFSANDKSSEEAIESSEAREYLLRQSIIYTFEKPVFGVGPGQFSSYEGSTMHAQGLQGNWHETHNSFTQVSSECGIPALCFYAAAIFFTFRTIGKIRKRAKSLGNQEVQAAAFCLAVSLVAYCTSTAFVNFAYHFYLLAFSGIVIAIWSAIREDGPARGMGTIVPAGARVDPLTRYLREPAVRSSM